MNGLEQTVPFKIVVFPNSEQPTKQNGEVILVNAYTPSTRVGTITAAEVLAGSRSPGWAQVSRVLAGDGGTSQSEVQLLTLLANAGTFTLSFGGSTTAALAYNASAATVQTALQGLGSIGASNATVSGSAGGPYTITFAAALANMAQALIGSDGTALTYGIAGSVTPATVTNGGGGNNEVQTITVAGSTGSFTLTFGGNTTNAIGPLVSAAVVQAELEGLASIGPGNVAVTGVAGGPFTVTFQGALANTNVAQITADSTLLALGGQNEVQTFAVDADAGTFRLSADAGVNYTGALAYNASAATVQTALRGLAAIGAGNCVVSLSGSVYTVSFVSGLSCSSVSLLTVDASSLSVVTAHVTDCDRAQDGTTARSIVVGDIVEVTVLADVAIAPTFILAPSTTYNDFGVDGYAPAGLVPFTMSGSGVRSATITGFTGGTDGRRLIILMGASGSPPPRLILAHLNAGSQPGNQFEMFAGADLTLTFGQAVEFIWQSVNSKWLQIGSALTTPSGLLPPAGSVAQVLRKVSVADYDTEWHTPAKADVGLGSADNTADASKNVATAAALTTARTIDGQSFDGSANITVIAPGTHAATSKATPVDADELPLADSAASFVLKKLTWANLKATVKTYTDTLYPSGSGTSSGTNTGDQTSVSGNAGTATTLQTSRNIDGQAFNGSADITVIAPGTHAATSKATPVDADELPLVDSAASNVLKKLTWANVKATLLAYFNTQYPIIYSSGVANTLTGTTTETSLATISLPAGLIGANGSVQITALFVRNGVGTSTVSSSVRYGAAGSGTGGTAIEALAATLTTAQLSILSRTEFFNANNASTQVFYPHVPTTGPYNIVAAGTNGNGSINTGNAVDINICGKLANAGDALTLKYYRVVVYPHT